MSLQSIYIPRNLIQFTCSILILSMEILYSHGAFVYPKTMKFVFDKLSERLFNLNHVYSLFISVDTFVHSSNKSLPSTKKLVSSANSMDFKYEETSH